MDEPPSEPLVLGKGVHAVIEAALKTGQHSEDFFSAMCDVVTGVLPLKIQKDELMFLAYQPNVLEHIGKPCCIEYHFQDSISPDNPFSPEIQGYLDHWIDVGDHIEIRDWKSNRKTYNPTDTHQLGIYADHLQRKTGKPVKGKLVFLRNRKVLEHLYSAEDIAVARSWALEKAEGIRKLVKEYKNKETPVEELFPATPGDVCRYCGWANMCTGKEIKCPSEIDNTKAVEVGAEIFRLEAALKLLKKNLRAYVKNNGPVRVGKREFTLVPSRSWNFNSSGLEKVFNKMKNSGVDPFGYFTITAGNLRKLKWEESDIEALGGKPRTTTTFRDVAVEEPKGE